MGNVLSARPSRQKRIAITTNTKSQSEKRPVKKPMPMNMNTKVSERHARLSNTSCAVTCDVFDRLYEL